MIQLGILSLEHPHSRGNHIPALKYMGDRIQVSAIYHPDESFAQPWCQMFGAKYYSTREALLADPAIDAVLITSTNDHHAQDVIAAAQAGKDIFCDKPVCIDRADGQRMIDAVRQNQVTFLTTFPVRFNDAVLAVKEKITAGDFGKILAIVATNHGCMYEPGAPEWVMDPMKNGGGCIIDHTVHVADIIRWFTGEEFETVRAEARHILRPYIDAEDVAVMHGTMTGGAIFQIDASWSRRPADPMWGDVTIRVVGEKQTAWLDIYNNQRVEIYVEGELEMHYPNLVAKEHGDIFDDYVRFRQEGTPLVGAGVVDGVRTIELAYAAYDSLREGKTLAVKRCKG